MPVITVGGRVELRGLGAVEEADARDCHTFPNPALARKAAMGLWTGGIDPEIRTWRDLPGGGLSLPRGAEGSVPGMVVDRTSCPPAGDRLRLLGEMRGYQERAVAALLGRRTGVMVAPTGSGKTCMMMAVAAALGTTVLILVHTGELLRQTEGQVRRWLGVAPGVCGGGRWEPGRSVAVATVQTLARRGVEGLGRFGAVLTDEAHHLPAETWSGVVDSIPARFKYGFSATPERKDGLRFLLDEYIGPVRAVVSRLDVEAAGGTVPYRRVEVPTLFETSVGSASGWVSMVSEIVADESRNGLVAGVAAGQARLGRRVLVLTERVGHAEALGLLLAGLSPVVLHGGMPAGARARGMAAVSGGALVTVATQSLMGEGVDVPGWDALVLATPTAGGARAVQSVGRVLRAAPGKSEALVFDLVDVMVPILAAAARGRKRSLEAA